MRLSSTETRATPEMLFAAFLALCVLSSKKILIYNEELIVALCFLGFVIFSRRSFSQTVNEILDQNIERLRNDLKQRIYSMKMVKLLVAMGELREFRYNLEFCGTIVKALPEARFLPQCETTVQALLCRNLNVKLATLMNATSLRRISLQDGLVNAFHFSVSERFVPGSTLKASTVELIRESLLALRKVRVGH
jgi:Ca2+/Na+ antiporter